MRLRFLLALIALSLLGLPMATAAQAAPAVAAATPTSLTVQVSTHRATYRQRLSIHGQVVAGNAGVPGLRVRLEMRPLGTPRWSVVGHRVTQGSLASYQFSRRATRNTLWRVRFAGNQSYGPSSGTATVRVYRLVTGKVAHPHSSWFMTGRVSPGYAGRPVHLMRQRCKRCAFRTYATQRTGPGGRYRFRLPVPRTGTHYFKVRVPASTAFLLTDSPTWTLTRLG